MKKIILSLAAASLVFASCSKETTTSEIEGNPGVIGFDLNTGKTRADVANLVTLQGDDAGFGVYATKYNGVDAQEEFIDDQAYIYDDVTDMKWEWSGTDNMWPNTEAAYPVNFYAYHPKASTTGGLELSGNLQYSYTISTTMSVQKDLLAAQKLGVTTRPASSNVALDFKHILSKVQFQIQAGAGMTVEVQSIKIRKVGNYRTFDFSNLSWVGSPGGQPDFSYLVASDAHAAFVGPSSGTSTAAAVTGTDEGSLMLIPQTFALWNKAAATINTASYIEVVYRMTETTGGKDVVGYTDATKYNAGETEDYDWHYSASNDAWTIAEEPAAPTGNLFVKVGYPIDTTWEKGKSYTYTIKLGTPDSSGGNLTDDYFIDEDGDTTLLPVIHPDTEEDINVPDPIVNTNQPIDFIVTVGEWTEVTAISLY